MSIKENDLPAELADQIAALNSFSDKALWKVARSRMPVKSVRQLEQLHFKRLKEGLTESEVQTSRELVAIYNRYMLTRAHAAVLLKERGFDVSNPISNRLYGDQRI